MQQRLLKKTQTYNFAFLCLLLDINPPLNKGAFYGSGTETTEYECISMKPSTELMRHTKKHVYYTLDRMKQPKWVCLCVCGPLKNIKKGEVKIPAPTGA